MRPLAAVVLALLALPALAEEKVDVKLKVKKGFKFTRTTDVKGDGNSAMAFGDNKELKMLSKAEINLQTKLVEEVQEEKDGVPAKLRRRYLARATQVNLGMFGARMESGGYVGKEIVLEPDDKRSVADGGHEEALKKEWYGDPATRAFASGQAVAVGGTWNADKAAVKAWIEAEFRNLEVDEAEMECTLKEVRDKDGRKCAHIEFKLKGEVHLDLGEGRQSKVRINLKGDAEYAPDAGMIIEVKGEGKLRHAKDADEEDDGSGGQFARELDLPFDLKTTVKVGEADFDAKLSDKPNWMKPKRPDWTPPPVR